MNDTVTPLNLPLETKHLPLVFLVFLIINAVILRFRYTQLAASRPDLAQGYQWYFTLLVASMALPWVIMAVGLESGQVPNFFALFHPRDGNVFVVGFYGVAAVMMVLFVWWIFLGKGAEFMVQHPGTMNGKNWTVAGIRLWAAAAASGGCVGLVLRLLDIPHIPF